ncbi:hypothetical protein MMC18_001694 [Xylographa bjoerkii]|nr:hypothetical protein [Xylographa bjoerkii]
MAKWEDLPTEVVENITCNLEDAETLSALSAVCKALYKISQPVLYKSIDFDIRHHEGVNPPVHKLLRSFLRSPELALYTRSLRFCGGGAYLSPNPREPEEGILPEWSTHRSVGQFRSIWDYEDNTGYTQADWTLAHDYIQSFEPKQPWIEGLHQGRLDLYVALIIYHAQNLQFLEIGFDFQLDVELLVGMLGAIPFTKTMPWFDQLHEVCYSRPYYNHSPEISSPLRAENILPLLYLPSIKVLNASIGNPETFSWPAAEAPRCLSLTVLELHASTLREDHLIHLLRAAPNLKGLMYKHSVDEQQEETGHSIFDCTKLRQALNQVRSTLERLTVSVDIDSSYGVGEIETRGDLGPLLDFPKLKFLDMPPQILLGGSPSPTQPLSPRLPQGLKHLQFSYDGQSLWGSDWTEQATFSTLREYLAEWQMYTPELEKITLRVKLSRWSTLCDKFGKAARTQLRSLCEWGGVGCVAEVWLPDQ